MCFPTGVSPRGHFLREPIIWASNVWKRITEIQGSDESIVTKYFALLPVLDSHIDDLVDMRLLQDRKINTRLTREDLLQDFYVSVNLDLWSEHRATAQP